VIKQEPSATGATHPKDRLYARVYDPLTQEWFHALRRSKRVGAIVADAANVGLLATMNELDQLFSDLVDEVLDHPEVDTRDIIATTSANQQHVLWVGHAAPLPGANHSAVGESLRKKMTRNISLGVVEALICLQSAYRFGWEELELRGADLENMLRRSRQLYASLAVLHDDQEQVRLQELAGITGFLKYPETDYEAALEGRVSIAVGHFVRSGSPQEPRLRFRSSPVPPPASQSPIKRCPAQRLRAADGRPLNDELWDLLIDVYRSAGQFDH
jgi:hypothetical protein